jgi:hypothetical protein
MITESVKIMIITHVGGLYGTKENFLLGFKSQSSYIALSEDDKTDFDTKLDHLFESLDPIISTPFSTTIYLCKKRT